jgi:serine/threonine protein kinase
MHPGNRLGPYGILSAIGAGGMGEVYRARDSKLGRDVALKVLPDASARDAERMERFQREAKVLASLNHPNIATIHGLEDSGATHALVMELVEGPTLADRINSGPLPVDEAVLIAKQIAEGLEYAHERGIVHRDLKPANVKVSRDDSVKILDFGLAKAVEGEAVEIDMANSPTLTRMATQAGFIIGTAAYMSPEQAKGKPVDRARTSGRLAACCMNGVLLDDNFNARRCPARHGISLQFESVECCNLTSAMCCGDRCQSSVVPGGMQDPSAYQARQCALPLPRNGPSRPAMIKLRKSVSAQTGSRAGCSGAWH